MKGPLFLSFWFLHSRSAEGTTTLLNPAPLFVVLASCVCACDCTRLRACVRACACACDCSGDEGVWGHGGLYSAKFNPDFPAASPFVTAVGGTEFASAKAAVGSAEVGSIGSGGGFSNTFGRPDYQAHAVEAYLASGVKLPAPNLWNNSGTRAYPDISALFGKVIPYCIVSASRYTAIDGTSASTPVVAAQFAMLNAIRLAKGQPALGFVNPFLYQTLAAYPEAFHDIVNGTNNDESHHPGFTAATGWDVVSGVGTPNFGILASLV